ncbi:bifunctional 2-polyprenyl-6-hydroxyphenol methylase/3-demethylubiquinol 3-O-methyltransferase UbiG [Streptomyces sp. CNQ085]|uniref:class I SAM-dependent methyltransferase n=1 Tax=Streptomyces sp. CNQ085 TaxID=2886944 RepID=UPI001F50DB2F|nr:class I SAM-dependent methyltransferase [Streptomyces sp. CNQ085]MCI0382849.1 class I SAM-dependent methyltransferase [Streptomyces sp. CNQ085]
MSGHTTNGDGTDGASAEEFWDELYGADERIWSGEPNAALVRETADLVPGGALDLGCGEGGDAIWLARRGWRVTAVDISRIALDRGAEQARRAGVADRIDWLRHDLAESFPEGSFDLVSVHFLHAPSPIELPRQRILRDAAAAVSPGGVLLVVGHADPPPGAAGHGHGDHPPLPTSAEVLASLGLPEEGWEPLVSGERRREATGPDGQWAVFEDAVLKLRRLTG